MQVVKVCFNVLWLKFTNRQHSNANSYSAFKSLLWVQGLTCLRLCASQHGVDFVYWNLVIQMSGVSAWFACWVSDNWCCIIFKIWIFAVSATDLISDDAYCRQKCFVISIKKILYSICTKIKANLLQLQLSSWLRGVVASTVRKIVLSISTLHSLFLWQQGVFYDIIMDYRMSCPSVFYVVHPGLYFQYIFSDFNLTSKLSAPKATLHMVFSTNLHTPV